LGIGVYLVRDYQINLLNALFPVLALGLLIQNCKEDITTNPRQTATMVLIMLLKDCRKDAIPTMVSKKNLGYAMRA